MTDTPRNDCSTCLAYHKPEDVTDDAGECRRYAPTPSDAPSAAWWPRVCGTDFCLQHRQAVAPFDLTFIPVDRVDNFGAGDA